MAESLAADGVDAKAGRPTSVATNRGTGTIRLADAGQYDDRGAENTVSPRALDYYAAGPTLFGCVVAMTVVEVREFSGRCVAPVQAYGQRALTAATTFVRESLASPNNSVVFGSKSSSLSMPAKPGRIERFMNTMLRASSTARIGIP